MSVNISAYWAAVDNDMSMRRRAANAANVEAHFPALVAQPATSATSMYENLVAANRRLIQADRIVPFSTGDSQYAGPLPREANIPDR